MAIEHDVKRIAAKLGGLIGKVVLFRDNLNRTCATTINSVTVEEQKVEDDPESNYIVTSLYSGLGIQKLYGMEDFGEVMLLTDTGLRPLKEILEDNYVTF